MTESCSGPDPRADTKSPQSHQLRGFRVCSRGEGRGQWSWMTTPRMLRPASMSSYASLMSLSLYSLVTVSSSSSLPSRYRLSSRGMSARGLASP